MLLSLWAVAFSSNALATPLTLQLKWKHQFQFAGFYMAKEKGFYRNVGLDVDIKEVELGKPTVEELTKGHADYAVVDPGVLLPISKGAPVTILAAIFQHSPLALIVRKEASVRQLSDLRGKRIMMVPGLNADIEAALAKVGILPDSFIRQDISFNIIDLINGNTDAFSGYITDQPHQLELMGVPYRIFHPKEQGIDFYGDILVTTSREIENHPDRVKAFTEASMRGWQYALDHIDETIDVILSRYNTQQLSRKQLLFEAIKTKEMILGDVVQVGYMSRQRWQRISGIYAAMGLLPDSFNINDALYQPEPDIFDYLRKNMIYISVIILLLISLLLALHSVRLRSVVRQRTDSLKSSEQRLAAAQQLAHIGSWAWDIDRNELLWSDEVFRIFGLDPELHEATYEAFLSFVHPDDRTMLETQVSDALKGEPYSIEHRIVREDGSERIVHEMGSVRFDNAGKPLEMIGTIHDITEQHRLEQRLHQARKMESLATLIGGIAHDFNSKMAAITGNTYLAKKDKSASTELHKKLDNIESQTFEMSELLKQLITFTHGDVFQKETVDLNSTVRQALESSALSEHIVLHQNLSENALPILAAPPQIQTAVIRIIENAVDAIAGVAHPTIDISSSLFEANPKFLRNHPRLKDGPFAKLEIKDNGEGIASEIIGRVFEPFYTTKDKVKGQGLGLSIAYGLIQQHDGDIEINSAKGLGTSVNIYLPLISKQQMEQTPPAAK